MDMTLTYLERKLLTTIRDGEFDYDQVAPASRGGVLASLSKKGFTESQTTTRTRRSRITGRRFRFKTSRLVVTKAGMRALRKKPPSNQRDDYRRKQGLRKLHGLNPNRQPDGRIV
jgi:hypothetical protein